MLKRQGRLFLLAAAVMLAAACAVPDGADGADAGVRYSTRVTSTPRLKGVMAPFRGLYDVELKVIRDWGANVIRFPLGRNWMQFGKELDLVEYDAWFNSMLNNLESLLPAAKSLGLVFILDLHTPPGGWSAQNVIRMFDEPLYADHFVELWKRIATRFRNHPHRDVIWAYDLLNEPQLSQAALAKNALPALMLRAAQAVRAIDPESILIVSPNRGGAPFAWVGYEPLPLPDVIYQAHIYDPFFYTHQYVLPETTPPASGLTGPVEYPGIVGDEFWSHSRLEKEMQPVVDFQKKYGARIYIGEFSVVSWAPNADVWLADCLDIFDKHGWDYSYLSFRDWEGFSLEHEGTPPDNFWPDQDNPRKKVFLNGLRRK